MSIVGLIVLLVVLGLALALLDRIGMDPTILWVVRVVIFLAILLVLLRFGGLA